ncbi:DUF302 domain-containing protein [Neisseria iguanae]|uniref:DUF302 domain-containing protein n=1 Tax=Neisseria iguanae TaxID=90242 RepID=A0A2P7U001_9NEIS|nr:hypothetical protein C7N83_07190 [Neisseria iguanae]
MSVFKTFAIALFTTTVIAACATPADKHPQATRQGKRMNLTHSIESRYSFDDTVSRLQSASKEKGMKVFAVIDHQAAAKENGLNMQPAKVIVFGMPKAGTPLMVKDPEFALQLPLRVLVTETNGHVKVVFNDTRALIKGSKINYTEVENTLANAEKLIRKVVTE